MRLAGVVLADLYSCPFQRAMRIILLSDERIRLENGAPAPIAPEAEDISYSPFHMLASGIGTCMFSVLQSWATNAKIPTDHLSMEIGWKSAKNPNRAGSFDVKLLWPSLPKSRRAAAARAANSCTAYSALVPPPEVHVGMGTVVEPSPPDEATQ